MRSPLLGTSWLLAHCAPSSTYHARVSESEWFGAPVRRLYESLCLCIRSDTMIKKLVSSAFPSLDVPSASNGTDIYFSFNLTRCCLRSTLESSPGTQSLHSFGNAFHSLTYLIIVLVILLISVCAVASLISVRYISSHLRFLVPDFISGP